MNNQEIFDLLESRKVIIIAGEYGRGKTLSAVALTWFLTTLYQHYNVLSNIPINFKFIELESLTDSHQFDKEHKNTIIIHDEMQRDFNARDFLSSSAKIVSKFSVDFRKDESKLISTIQFMNRLDSALNEIIQIIIIPTFINQYSHNDKEDTKIRLEKKDFITNWRIIDKKYEEKYDMKLNLFPFLNMYDTKFKPYPLVINHDEFIERQQKNLSQIKYENLKTIIDKKLQENKSNWNNGLTELVKR